MACMRGRHVPDADVGPCEFAHAARVDPLTSECGPVPLARITT
jgi:hypothetical protein